MIFSKREGTHTRAFPSSTAQQLQTGHSGSGMGRLIMAGLSVVAIGCLAFVGMQQFVGDSRPATVYSSAPPSGLANTVMNALKAPHDRKREAARLALLNDNVGPMEVRNLETVEALANPNAPRPATSTPITVASTPEQLEQIVEVTPKPKKPELKLEVAEDGTLELVVENSSTNNVEIVSAAPREPIYAKPCYVELVEQSQNLTIFFQPGASQLQSKDLGKLAAFAQRVSECPHAIVQITGHSDSTGDEQVNMALSWQRADNTIAAIREMGIDTTRLDPVGFGSRSPFAQGASDEELDRRVEFHVLRRETQN